MIAGDCSDFNKCDVGDNIKYIKGKRSVALFQSLTLPDEYIRGLEDDV